MNAKRLFPDVVRVIEDIEYGVADGVSLRLDLYLPAGDEKHPLIVFIHGGSWSGGDKRDSAFWAERFAGYGYAVAEINYRLVPGHLFPAQVHDCKAAVRWLKANAATYGLNPMRVGAYGASAGGHLVAMLGVSCGVPELEGTPVPNAPSSCVQAVCNQYGPTDLVRVPWDSLVGGPIATRRAAAALASPVTHVSATAAPHLIMHGTLDPIVPLDQSQTYHRALVKAGAESTLHVFEGAEHGFKARETIVLKLMDDFFALHLRGERRPAGYAVNKEYLHRYCPA